MAHCKGIAVISRFKWVQERHGDAGTRSLLDALPAQTVAVTERHILPNDWVPMQVFIDVNVAVDQLFGKGDLALCRELGAWAAQANLPRLFRLFYRLGSPTFIFERASKLWSAHYDSGRLETFSTAPGSASLRLFEFDQPHPAHCLSVLGWAAKSIELSGSTVTEARDPRCRVRGDDCCELVVAWRG